MISAGWHAHLNCDWWRLPSGEAALALCCWQAPGNRGESLDWTIVEVTLGPDSQRPVYGSWALSVGENTRTRLVTSASARGRVQGEGLRWGQWEAGAWAWDLGWPRVSPRGKAYIKGDGKLGLGCIDCGKKQDLGQLRSPRGKAYIEGNGKLGLGV